MHSMTKEQERIEKVRAEEVLACTAVVGVSHVAHATQARARSEAEEVRREQAGSPNWSAKVPRPMLACVEFRKSSFMCRRGLA